jgi:hypothetical protein
VSSSASSASTGFGRDLWLAWYVRTKGTRSPALTSNSALMIWSSWRTSTGVASQAASGPATPASSPSTVRNQGTT